jgi:hypothetical protein
MHKVAVGARWDCGVTKPGMQKNKILWIEIAVCVAAFMLVTILSDHFQSRISLHDGKGWDGAFYYKTAEQVVNGESISGEGPYVFRVGLPILVAKVNKSDLLAGFKQVNLAANVLYLILFMAWLRLFLEDWKTRCLMVLLVLTQWHGPFRFISYYPATTDNAQFVFLLLGFLGVHMARTREIAGTIWVCLAVFVGVFFRETIAVVGFAMPFLSNPIQFKGIVNNLAEFKFTRVVRLPKLIYCVPAVFGLAGLACAHLMVHKLDGGYSFSKTLFNWIYDKPWPTYLHAVFIVFGPAVVLAVFNWRKSWAFLESNQFFLAFIGATLFLGYVGGDDTERILSMATPIVCVLIGKAIEDNRLVLQSKPLVLLLCAAQLVAHRAFWTIPDFPSDYHTHLPVLTVLGSKFQYPDLWSFHGRRIIEAVSLAEYVLLAVVLIWWLSNRAKRTNAATTA